MNLRTIHNGFWWPGTTGWAGRSRIKDNHIVEEGRTLIRTPDWLNKYLPERLRYNSYGLQRHVPKDKPYKLSYVMDIMEHFNIKVRIYATDGNFDKPREDYICTLATQVHPKVYDNEFVIVDAWTKAGLYVGDLKWAYKLIKLGIYNPECIYPHSNVVSIGYSKKDHKWYGWSHRAMYGFTIGSTVKKGDCAYRPTNKKEFMEDQTRFWENEHHAETMTEIGTNTLDDGTTLIGCWTRWVYTDDVPNVSIRGTVSGVFKEFPVFGRGEWTAETMEDARQMAIDFSNNVS